MRPTSPIEIVLKKTPRTFTAKPKEPIEEPVKNYKNYSILADAAFDSILYPPTLVKTPGFIKRFMYMISFKFKRYLVKKRLEKFYSSKNGIAIDDRAALAIKALEVALRDPKNTLLMAPNSGSRYVQTPNSNVFIILKYQTIILSNHQYYYEIALSSSVSEYLADKFDKMIESRRRQMERKMLENSKATLEAAVLTLSQKMIKNTARKFTHL